MPTYDYKCNGCGIQFEKFESIKAKPSKKCPECGGAVKRLIGTGGMILFKGSGFYETDYKKKSSSTTEGSTAASTSASSSSSTSSASSASSTPSTPSTPSATPPAGGNK